MLTVRNPEAERIAYDLASRRGQAVDEVVLTALRAEWSRLEAPVQPTGKPLTDPAEVLARVRRIVADIDRLPVLDDRNPNDILGYDETGAFDGHRQLGDHRHPARRAGARCLLGRHGRRPEPLKADCDPLWTATAVPVAHATEARRRMRRYESKANGSSL
ncbi:type II toxin-antitoxin system VapB family antitoxin [Azospirillum isscasi]|uniref:Type II toxin-antitoxin system VapB family antitoxin n=1 Tax=Azospirillum isscasi TaxID=3053926 RepID=A0ABU0WJK0_9PROT|nr:type II toxin-antitoxin system VapB family antitoxin [Azospirillum isscasi]MDQ2104400.1 type II toxin-antitoxin system VapB family antitoxin [Azospirillum isscasi]